MSGSLSVAVIRLYEGAETSLASDSDSEILTWRSGTDLVDRVDSETGVVTLTRNY